MADFFSDFWKILKLDIGVFERIKNDKAGLFIALRLFLVISLLISFGTFVTVLVSGPKTFATPLENATSRLEQLATSKLPPVVADGISTLQQQVQALSAALDEYQPPLGRDLSFALRALGGWLTVPLSMLGGWMVAALAVFLVAKILKGQGDLREHTSVFILGFAPQILLLVSSFAYFGTLLGVTGALLSVVAFVWSLVIIISALRAVHGFSAIKSVSVLLLTFLVFGVLVPAILLMPPLIGLVAIF
jgi:hypothetical protein